MTSTLMFAAIAGLAFWVVVGYFIWKWGPGLRRRSVQCPVLKRRAKVLADQREAEFASLKVVDVKACSLLNGSLLMCNKECLTHL